MDMAFDYEHTGGKEAMKDNTYFNQKESDNSSVISLVSSKMETYSKNAKLIMPNSMLKYFFD